MYLGVPVPDVSNRYRSVCSTSPRPSHRLVVSTYRLVGVAYTVSPSARTVSGCPSESAGWLRSKVSRVSIDEPEYRTGRCTRAQSTRRVVFPPAPKTSYRGSHSSGPARSIPPFSTTGIRGAERVTTRTTLPTCRASTSCPSIRKPPATVGVRLARSTRSSRGPTIPPAVPQGRKTSALSPYNSRFVGSAAPSSASVPVSCREVASTTHSTPRLTVMIRFPSVLTRSPSSTPWTWVLVCE